MMRLRHLLAGAVIAAVPVSTASASPPIFDQSLKPCYVAARPDQLEPVQIEASGFTPLAPVDVYIDDLLQPVPAGAFPAQADINGRLSDGAVPAPYIDSGQRQFTLRLTEPSKPENSVSATSKVTKLSVEQAPRTAKTNTRVRFRGRGFTGGMPVYAHYVFAGKSRKTVKVGDPYGACGLFSVRMRQFPFRKAPRVGEWFIYFDQVKNYHSLAPLRVPLRIVVRRTIKPHK